MPGLGPFEVTAEQVVRLGSAFATFVNELLEHDTARSEMLGHQLRITSKQETPDGGVDAQLIAGVQTSWIPEGDSAWQFKRTDLRPTKCRRELEGAAWAQRLIKEGASYRLLLGAALNSPQIEARRRSLVTAAEQLGVIANDDGRIQVIDANGLARWVAEFPSLAVSRTLGGPGGEIVDYSVWSASNRHQHRWVSDTPRDGLIEGIRHFLRDQAARELRVEGTSGIGKTRLVMRALDDLSLNTLVAYLHDVGSVSGEILNYLLSDGRTAILVVDECPRRSHEKLAERIPAGSSLKLLTIGDSDAYSLLTPILEVRQMSESDIDEFLKENYRQIPVESRRFVGEHSAGNIRFAIVLADRIVEVEERQAAELIRLDDVTVFAQNLIREGRPFFLASLIGLFERVGWDRELREQAQHLSAFSDAPMEELDELAREMESRGLLIRQGRYRAISPHPLAVVLAAYAWRREGDRIVSELLPNLPREMALSLFNRAADLGRYEPARVVLKRLMSRDGPFGTLESIETSDLGRFITQLAIVAPDKTVSLLAELIEEATPEDLRRQTRSRRELVWALEKLVWHRETFERAADCLLRLSVAENENYANNATGTWMSLFGAGLPATAAEPQERVDYLRRLATSVDTEIRLRVVRACSGALHRYEVTTVSGELQGGVLVEPRGSARTYGEAGVYRGQLIDLLSELAQDLDQGVATEARKALLDAILPLIDDPFTGDKLIAALVNFEGESLSALRQQIEHLRSLVERRENAPLATAITKLAESLPPAGPSERLRTLLMLQPWDLEEGDLRSQVESLAQEAIDTDPKELLKWLREKELPGAWFLGHALGSRLAGEAEVLSAVFSAAELNFAGLVGYLQALVDGGQATAFDDFLDGDLGGQLSDHQVLALTVRGPVSDKAKQRVLILVDTLPTQDGAYGTFGWQRNLGESELQHILRSWIPRVDSQRAYNAVIDWLNLWLHPDRAIPSAVRSVVLDFLERRQEFPDLGNQNWDWGRLAAQYSQTDPLRIATIVFDLITRTDLIVIEDDQEVQLVAAAAATEPTEVWAEVASRLEQNEWRIPLTLRGWFTNTVPLKVLQDWIGDSSERARIVATMASAGGAEPTEISQFLLDRFGDDRQVASALAAEYTSGSWTGNESDYLSDLIAQLANWRRLPGASENLRGWALKLMASLERQRSGALEREAERGW